MIIEEDVYLEHYGVKGQKWGVRRANRKSMGSEGRGQVRVKLKSKNILKDKSIGQRILGPKKPDRDAALKRHSDRVLKVRKALSTKDKAKAREMINSVKKDKRLLTDAKLAYSTTRGARLGTAIVRLFTADAALAAGGLKIRDVRKRNNEIYEIMTAKV